MKVSVFKKLVESLGFPDPFGTFIRPPTSVVVESKFNNCAALAVWDIDDHRRVKARCQGVSWCWSMEGLRETVISEIEGLNHVMQRPGQEADLDWKGPFTVHYQPQGVVGVTYVATVDELESAKDLAEEKRDLHDGCRDLYSAVWITDADGNEVQSPKRRLLPW